MIECAAGAQTPMTRERRVPVLSLTASALAVLLAAVALGPGASEDGIRSVVRWTAKIAVVLFCAAFAASSLRVFFRSEWTRQLMRHRRQLGVSFALAHTLHLAALVALGIAFPSPFLDELNAVTIVGGGLAYVFMFAMAATSNDGAVRRLGLPRWRLLHTIGGWYIWIIFTQSYLPRALQDPLYAPFGVLLLGVLGLRIARRVRERGRARAARSSSALGESPHA